MPSCKSSMVQNYCTNIMEQTDRYFGDKRVIRIYLFALNVEEQALLIPFNIILPKNYPKPLFEYSTYTTSIGFYLTEGIENWLIDEGYGTDNSHYSIIIDYERVDDDDEPVNAVKCSLIKMLLRTSKKIKYFSLTKTNNKLIFENLYTNTTITELSIEDIHFDSAEIKELMEYISKNTILTFLDLSNNYLGPEGGKTLSDAICKNTTLNIYCNQFDFKRAKALT
ncbi:small GTP-binding protein, partial [Gigaspora margarita]